MTINQNGAFAKACLPCKKRKSRCAKVKPCPSCVCHETQDDCYSDQVTSYSSLQLGAGYDRMVVTRQAWHQAIAEEGEASLSPLLQRPKGTAITACPEVKRQNLSFTSRGIFGPDVSPLIPFPRAEECEMAFYCYIDEIEFQSVTVDQCMRQEFRRFIMTGKAPLLAQAFFYLVFAIVGKVASGSTTICQRVPSIRSRDVQDCYLGAASLAMSMDNGTQGGEGNDEEETHSSVQLLRAQVMCLRATYHHLTGEFKAAAKELQESTKYADLAGLYDTTSARFQMLDSDAQIAGLRFRGELAIPACWIFSLTGQIVLHPRETMREYPESDNDSITHTIFQHKLEASRIAVEIQTMLAAGASAGSDASGRTSSDDKSIELIRHEQLLGDILSGPISKLAAISPRERISDAITYQRLSTANIIRQYLLTLQCTLLQQLCRAGVAPSSIQAKTLQVAFDSLAELRTLRSLLATPWHTLGRVINSVLNTSMHVEVAMSVFASAIEQQVSPTSFQNATTISSTPTTLAAFASNFKGIYTVVNHLGLLGPSSFRCAQMLWSVPVKRSLSLHINKDDDGNEDEDDTFSYESIVNSQQDLQRSQQGRPGPACLDMSSHVSLEAQDPAREALSLSYTLYNLLNNDLKGFGEGLFGEDVNTIGSRRPLWIQQRSGCAMYARETAS